MTRIIQPSLDYTDRDFDSLKYRLQGLARSVFPDWTDFNVPNFGNLMLEMFSFVGDVLHFYQDNQAGEAFIPTLTHRMSMIRLGQLINFTMTGAAAATATETLSIPQVSTANLNFARGTRLRTADPENPVPFQTVADATITAGSLSTTVGIEQSERKTQTLVSTGEPNQEFVLPDSPYLDGSLDVCERDGLDLLYGVSASNGDYYRVSSFLGALATDRVFVAMTDQLDRCHLYFGNGVCGAIPQGTIQVAFKVGGGASGNVEAGKVSILEDSLYFEDGAPASVVATNAAAATGGADRMTLEEAALQAPASLRVLTRTVTKSDFEDVAVSLRGVARALMATSNEYAGIEENTGRLYIVARGTKLSSGCVQPSAPDSTLLTNIGTYITATKPSTITFSYSTLAAPLKEVDIQARVYLKYGAVPATVSALIQAALADFFAVQLSDGTPNPNVDFGANIRGADNEIIAELAWSDVFNSIRDIVGVRKVDEHSGGLLLNGRTSSVSLLPIEFPVLGSITLINADTGDSL